jgi:hypothetical protein
MPEVAIVIRCDSLTHVRLLLTIERAFAIRFSTSEIGKLEVGDLVALIKAHSAGGSLLEFCGAPWVASGLSDATLSGMRCLQSRAYPTFNIVVYTQTINKGKAG